jgi:DNA (cytosine-5)-methyltransferase 1
MDLEKHIFGWLIPFMVSAKMIVDVDNHVQLFCLIPMVAVNKNTAKRPKTIRVVELFAGVGGFRVGLQRASKRKKTVFETVWANQWEPATKLQHAARTYEQTFFGGKQSPAFTNTDINKVVDDPKNLATIPEHDVLTGGFPCQDYSVARPLSQAAGLEGRKGVLWWSIYKILHDKIKRGRPTPYFFLENVDRLLKSPVSRRGRDFAIMLSSMSQLGYIVEWRVVNAADYGFPQRRRRTYLLGYHKTTNIAKEMAGRGKHKAVKHETLVEWVTKHGTMAQALPIASMEKQGSFTIGEDPFEITKNFMPEDIEGDVDLASPFQNSGIMVDLRIYTAKATPKFNGSYTTLGDIVDATDESKVDKKYYIHPDKVEAWRAQKSAHAFKRTSKSGFEYNYSEGAMPFPDKLDRASRTIITSEGGASPSRFKHVVDVTHKLGKKGRLIDGVEYKFRRLTPEELEACCMFGRGHTKIMADTKHGAVEVPDTKRAFFMGNALVVGMIEKIGRGLIEKLT